MCKRKNRIFLLNISRLFVPLTKGRKYFRSDVQKKKSDISFEHLSLIRTFAEK